VFQLIIHVTLAFHCSSLLQTWENASVTVWYPGTGVIFTADNHFSGVG